MGKYSPHTLPFPIPSPAKQNKVASKLQRVFLDMEAELSDEEGQAAPVSDDEADDVDAGGDLADLIAEDAGQGDEAARERLHREWEEAQDARGLQDVLRGLRRGFRRGRQTDIFDADEVGTRGSVVLRAAYVSACMIPTTAA